MRRSKLFFSALLVCALLGGGLSRPVSAAEGEAWTNPFCSASAYVIPWDAARDAASSSDSSDRYVLELAANGRENVAGTVTLIGDDSAYSVTIPRTALVRELQSNDREIVPVMVAFERPTAIRYQYVDTVGVDGADPAACPSVVEEVQPLTGATAAQAPRMGDVPSVRAAFLQKLPPLPCGKPYIPPSIDGEGPLVGHYGDEPKTTLVHVYLDSNGRPAQATIQRSSGIEGLDDAALGGVQQGSYRPAKFLCTPIVSEMIVEMRYDP